MATNKNFEVDVNRHTKYLCRCLDVLPEFLSSMDSIRTTLLFFGVNGLSSLHRLDAIHTKKQEIIRWLYGLQTRYCSKCGNHKECGFKGSYCLGNSVDAVNYSMSASQCGNSVCSFAYNDSHLAGTYTALCTLLTLGDDFAQVDRSAILTSLGHFQLANGSFSASAKLETESDIRFVYCAIAIAYILDKERLHAEAKNAFNDFDEFSASWWAAEDLSRRSAEESGYYFDIRQTVRFILSAQTYEGGFAQRKGAETHGGSTYCAVAALSLLGLLEDRRIVTPRRLLALQRWLVRRQPSAFAGRVNKEADSCYTFWTGATLRMLNYDGNVARFDGSGEVALSSNSVLSANDDVGHGAFYKVEMDALSTFLSNVQDTRCGGFQKCAGALSDPMHTCLALVGLSILAHGCAVADINNSALSEILQAAHPGLNIAISALSHLQTLHKRWSTSCCFDGTK